MVGLDKFKIDRVLTEVPPVPDEKGEITEVQVLEEGGVFDPDETLDQMDEYQSRQPTNSKKRKA